MKHSSQAETPQLASSANGSVGQNAGVTDDAQLKRLALTSSAWAAIGTAASALLRLGSNLIVTRLIAPDAFGISAIVLVVMVGIELMSDLGVGPAIVQHARGNDRRFLNTAFTIQVVRGCVLWLIACLLAWPVALFYDEPMFMQLIPVAGLTAINMGAYSTAMHTAKREMRLALLTVVELLGQLMGVAVMIVWAILSPTVWALVSGGLMMSFSKCVLSHLLLDRVRNRFDWEPEAARSLFDFGKWIFINSGLYFWATNGDRLILGKLVSFAQLGFYSIAFNLAQPLVMLNYQISRSVLLPLLSRVFREQPERMAAMYYSSRLRVDLMAIPALGAGVALAVPAVNFLYDPRYWDAGPLLQIFLVHSVLRCILDPAESCTIALGVPQRLTLTHVCRTVGILLGIPIGWFLLGINGVVWAVCLSEIPVLVLVWKCLSDYKLLRIRREALVPVMLAGGYLCGELSRRLLGL